MNSDALAMVIGTLPLVIITVWYTIEMKHFCAEVRALLADFRNSLR